MPAISNALTIPARFFVMITRSQVQDSPQTLADLICLCAWEGEVCLHTHLASVGGQTLVLSPTEPCAPHTPNARATQNLQDP